MKRNSSFGLLFFSMMSPLIAAPVIESTSNQAPSKANPVENQKPNLNGIVYGPGHDGPIKVEGQPGYNHPNQYMHLQPVSLAPNMEPVIVHPKKISTNLR